MHFFKLIRNSAPDDVSSLIRNISKMLLDRVPVNRNEWQGEVSNNPELQTYEASNIVLEYWPTSVPHIESTILGADMPWAEDHFQERISGKPLNPPPSAEKWPWHQASKEKHVDFTGVYSHTYPERFWPKFAGSNDDTNRGIRFPYGDLQDVVEQLKARPHSRQAYLPVFFPEDTGAPLFQRVPCTLGYHFIRNGMFLDCNYFIRSCDITRHLRNDIYFTVRLLQWMTEQTQNEAGYPMVGQITMFISNLHLFQGDTWRYQK